MIRGSREGTTTNQALGTHWQAVTAPGPELPSVDGTEKADVVVIGAGFTGLSAALALREAGADVVVVEAMEPGWGASGRNNGQVIPTLSRPDPDAIAAMHGEAGERFVALLRDSAADLFDLVRRERIEAEAEQTGWVQPAHSPGRMKIAERRVSQWSKRGAAVELLSRQDLSAKLGTDAWHGGWWAPSGGHINPLALVRGLTRRALEKGARIFVRTPALAINRTATHWVVTAPQGRVIARALVLATNAYTGEIKSSLAPEIAREVVPVLSWQMASEPVSASIRKTVMPERNAVSDTHGELYFMRYDARGRIITGGALALAHNGAERLKPIVSRRMERLFPALGRLRFDAVWNGYVGMTTDFMPRFHTVGREGFTWTGCNGRAVALSLSIGRELARAALGATRRDLALPFSEPRPLPLHGLVRRFAPMRLLEYRYRDRREI
jgi:glycine/D-amino acid oxidase-like deaminating enzyme